MTDKPPIAIGFDWDNTLIDNWVAIAQALNETFTQFGHEAWTLDQVRERCVLAARESFPEWFGTNWRRAYDFYYARFNEIHTEGLAPMPGAEELLLWLKEKEIPLFVVSNKRGDYLREQANALKWDKFFMAMVGAQDAPRDKPARDPIDYALWKAGLSASTDVWFVGDRDVDVQCAGNAGCTAVLIGNKEEAARLSVPLSFSDCHALRTLLYNRLGGKAA